MAVALEGALEGALGEAAGGRVAVALQPTIATQTVRLASANRRGERPLEQPRRIRPRPLLTGAAHSVATSLLVACVAITALLGTLFAHRTKAGALDAAVDARIQSALGGQRRILNDLAALGDLMPVIAMTAALVLVCLVTRRWRGAVLVAVAVPAAAGTSELVKPLIDRTLMGDLSFPSGHETRVFALAAAFAVLLTGPVWPRIPAAVRWFLAAAVLLAACAVAVALVGLDQHYFTDTVAGAAVGTAVVLATAIILDRIARRGDGPRDHSSAGPRVRRAGIPRQRHTSRWRMRR